MPQDASVLGFSNPWYEHAIATAVQLRLDGGAQILAATPSSIIATKLAAWRGRGEGDVLRSLDLHDVFVLIDGRAELSAEFARETKALRDYVATELAAVCEDSYFSYLTESALHGYGTLARARARELQGRIDGLMSLAG